MVFLPTDAGACINAVFTPGINMGSSTIVVDISNKQLDITGAPDIEVLTFTVDWISQADASHQGKVFSTGTTILNFKVNWPDSMSIDGDTTIVQGQTKTYVAHPSPNTACHVVNPLWSQTNSGCTIDQSGNLSVSCSATGTTTVSYRCKKANSTVTGSKVVTIIVPTASISGPNSLYGGQQGTFTVTTNYGGSYTFYQSAPCSGSSMTVSGSVTSSYGCSYSASKTVSVTQATASISGPSTLQVGQTASYTVSTNQGGSNTISYTAPSTPGTYTVSGSATSSYGCTKSASMSVTVTA